MIDNFIEAEREQEAPGMLGALPLILWQRKWFVIVPVELSVKLTSSGAAPTVGLAMNEAAGATFVTVI